MGFFDPSQLARALSNWGSVTPMAGSAASQIGSDPTPTLLADPNAATYGTPGQIKRRQQQPEALAKQGTDTSPIQSKWQGAARLAQGLLGGFEEHQLDQEAAKGRADEDARLGRVIKQLRSGDMNITATPGSTSPTLAQADATQGAAQDGDAASLPTFAGGNHSGVKMVTPDPAATDLTPQQKALLNGIAAPESAGAYNIRYTPNGGATFADLSQHPGIMEPGPAGPSSAAGRYQFTKSTWDSMGGGGFDPANQDRRALALAVRDYGQRTGRDLNADLTANGFTPQIAQALAPTWAGLGDNPDKAMNAYKASLQRYGNPSPVARLFRRVPLRSQARNPKPQGRRRLPPQRRRTPFRRQPPHPQQRRPLR